MKFVIYWQAPYSDSTLGNYV